MQVILENVMSYGLFTRNQIRPINNITTNIARNYNLQLIRNNIGGNTGNKFRAKNIVICEQGDRSQG